MDPGIARTFANATFMAHAPRAKALAHFERFAELMMRFRRDVTFGVVRWRGWPSCAGSDQSRRGVHSCLRRPRCSTGVPGAEPTLARSLAGIASVSAEPLATARKLLENFESVLCLAEKTHPSVARSVALSACRAADPLTTARLDLQNYDAIVKSVSRTDARRAHMVAAQAFRSNNPMRWAKRYLAELHKAG